MIKFMRITSIVLSIAAVLVYGAVTVYGRVSKDHKPPVIQMENSEITISTKDSREAVLSGVRASDDKDGDVSSSIVVESMGNFIKKGERKVTIAAFDHAGNVTKQSRTVRYSDYTSPKFSLNAPLQIKAGETGQLSSFVGASDCLDGDISSSVQIISEKTINTIMPGKYQVKLRAVNSGGDEAELPAELEIFSAEDFQSSRPMLSTYLVYTKKGQKIDAGSYVKGVVTNGIGYEWDSENPPKTGREKISINDRTDYNAPGVYEIVYTLPDEDGAAGGSVSLIVVVES